MNVRLVVTHMNSGKSFYSDAVEVEDDAELADAVSALARRLHEIKWLNIDGNILAGEFIRSQCVLKYIKVR